MDAAVEFITNCGEFVFSAAFLALGVLILLIIVGGFCLLPKVLFSLVKAIWHWNGRL